MPRLLVIIASTRPGRAGLPIANWFVEIARKQGSFEVEIADLAEIGLPFLDEPEHPRLQHYTKEHTKHWSEIVSRADAYVVVTPEYNYGAPATLINAFDFVYSEWNYKPAGFVSYGGVSGGTRAVQMAKQVMTTLKVMPMVEGVAIPFFSKFLTDDGGFQPEEGFENAAAMLAELRRWSDALQVLRQR